MIHFDPGTLDMLLGSLIFIVAVVLVALVILSVMYRD